VGVGSDGGRGAVAPLDFHTWYSYSRIEARPATKGSQGAKLLPGSNLVPSKLF